MEHLDRWVVENRVRRADVERVVHGLAAPARGRAGAPNDPSPVVDVPGLTARPFWDVDDFGWSRALRAATPRIVQEFDRLASTPADSSPPPPPPPSPDPPPTKPAARASVQSEFADRGRWSALYLYYAGQAYRNNVARCPQTVGALRATGAATLSAGGMTYFSAMAAHSHVTAHTGFLNAHLRAHLGLETPPGCRIRVADQVRAWRRGELMIFDDTFEHEVWNDGDARRVVLLFDLWHPDLTAVEREALTFLTRVWRRQQVRRALSAEVAAT